MTLGDLRALTKTTPAARRDTRRKASVRKYGDMAVELDALPVQVPRRRLVDEVEARIDMDALERTWQIEEADRERLVEMLAS